MTPHILSRLEILFQAAGKAHHKAFASTNGDDPDWPLWYADYLLEPLNQMLGVQLTVVELARRLRSVDEERREALHVPRPRFYARRFIDLHKASSSS